MTPSLPGLSPRLYALIFACTILFSCNEPNTNNDSPEPDDLERAEMDYEDLVKVNAAARLNQLGDSLFELAEYPAAMAFYQRSLDSAAAQADSFLYYDSRLDLACVYDRIGEQQKAVEIAEPVVDAFIRGGDSVRIGRVYTTLAGFYSKLKQQDKSLEASIKGFDILKQQNSAIHRCAAYNQMAFVYSDRGRWDQALPLLDTALYWMENSGALSQHPGMLLNIGNCHRELGHWPQARHYLNAAAAEADSLGQAHVYARCLERLSQVAESTGDPVTALRLFKDAKVIRDSIFTADKDHTLRELEVEYQTREKEQEIELLKAEQLAEKNHRRLLFAGLFFALTILGYTVYSYRMKLRRAQQKLDQNRQELQEYTRLLLSKNTQLTALEQAAQATRQENSADDDTSVESLYNSRILTDDDWEMFKHRFEGSYPGYLLQLRQAYPELSSAEERLLLLIKIGLNSQEVADTLGISPNGVKKGRQRLRKKLEISPEEDLELFVKKLLERS